MAGMKGTCTHGSWIRHFAISRDQAAIAEAVFMRMPNSSSISFAVLLVPLRSFIIFLL